MKAGAQAVVLAGLVFVWPGPMLVPHAAGPAAVPDVAEAPPVTGGVPADDVYADARAWFDVMKPSCNTVEVDVAMRAKPAPRTVEGDAYAAACWALAGKVDRARTLVAGLPADERWKSVGVVFDVAHPVADAGDDLAAGPIMELVVEFWPNHYMALYHAGAANFATGEYDRAREYLESFLEYYAPNDGWRRHAISMLEDIGKG